MDRGIHHVPGGSRVRASSPLPSLPGRLLSRSRCALFQFYHVRQTIHKEDRTKVIKVDRSHIHNSSVLCVNLLNSLLPFSEEEYHEWISGAF